MNEDEWKRLEEVHERYKQKFDKGYPMLKILGYGVDYVIALMEKCIEEGKPFEPPSPDALY